MPENNYQIYYNGRYYHGRGSKPEDVISRVLHYEQRNPPPTKHQPKRNVCKVTGLKLSEYGKGIEI